MCGSSGKASLDQTKHSSMGLAYLRKGGKSVRPEHVGLNQASLRNDSLSIFFCYQSIGPVCGENDDIYRRSMIGHTDSISPGSVLKVVEADLGGKAPGNRQENGGISLEDTRIY